MGQILKEQIIKNNGRHETDCGSPEVVVAILTEEINLLNSHIKKNPKDFKTKKGLLAKVEKRKKIKKLIKTNAN